ncbi:ribonuclease H-like domain-containing protein [Candidatus Woesebacteria bacterium]|nr:ribonuclease H-like domain-containing protein [Candidatus Woesebacteria bacterium]
MSQTLVIDIETIGENWDSIDPFTQENLSNWTRREAKNEAELKLGMDMLKEGLGFSPLTGEIVAIGIHDYEREKSAVYYQNLDSDKKTEEDGVLYQPLTEAEMLNKFWEVAQKYDVFVTFNGYQFDIPYLMIRGAIHGIKPTGNLLTNRYLTSQRGGKAHVDLIDQLSFYGAMRKKGSMHMWTRAFGISSPKSEEINGHQVAEMFKEKRYLDIARYNAADIKATAELYTKWLHFLKF